MSDLSAFAKHVQDVLSDGFREPHWTAAEAAKYMADIAIRRRSFEKWAYRINETIVKPRLETVAKLFPNATMSDEQRLHASCCDFEFCDRFPAYTSVGFSLEHDVRYEKLIVRSRISIVPVFVPFTGQDNLPLSLDSVDESEVADWVEERLLEFIDSYMQLDGESDELAKEVATDPVCGMQIIRFAAAASDSYYGHPYYFCSKDCLARFQDDPTQYVQIKTI